MTHDYDEDPIDVAAVSADDQLVERLRRSLSPDAAVVWGDDDDELSDDPSYTLLRAVQLDVTAELPEARDLPAGVTPLRTGRRLGRTATIAAVTAGVLSLAGAAAAASSPPLRSAVASAVSGVVQAITPDAPLGPKVSPPERALPDTPTATITPPGSDISAAARSAGAARYVEQTLDRADALLTTGQRTAAANALDAAARRLPLVSAGDGHDALQARLAALQNQLAALVSVTPAKPHGPGSSSGRSDAKPHATQAPDEHRTSSTDERSSRTRSRSLPLPKVFVHSTHAADRATQGR